MKNVLSTLVSVAVFGYVIYSWVPRYHTFDEGAFELGSDEYYIYEIASQSESPIKVELTEASGGKTFDAYLMDEAQYGELSAWMESDDLEQPSVDFMASWEGIASVSEQDIMVGEGLYYVVVDNTVLGQDYEPGKSLNVAYSFAEKF